MKKLLLCAVLLLSVLATVACDASILQIEDTNGAENAALATLTDAKLLDTMPQVVKQGLCVPIERASAVSASRKCPGWRNSTPLMPTRMRPIISQ